MRHLLLPPTQNLPNFETLKVKPLDNTASVEYKVGSVNYGRSIAEESAIESN